MRADDVRRGAGESLLLQSPSGHGFAHRRGRAERALRRREIASSRRPSGRAACARLNLLAFSPRRPGSRRRRGCLSRDHLPPRPRSGRACRWWRIQSERRWLPRRAPVACWRTDSTRRSGVLSGAVEVESAQSRHPRMGAAAGEERRLNCAPRAVPRCGVPVDRRRRRGSRTASGDRRSIADPRAESCPPWQPFVVVCRVPERYAPHLALVSAGRGNPFGHPSGEVIDRLMAAGAARVSYGSRRRGHGRDRRPRGARAVDDRTGVDDAGVASACLTAVHAASSASADASWTRLPAASSRASTASKRRVNLSFACLQRGLRLDLQLP